MRTRLCAFEVHAHVVFIVNVVYIKATALSNITHVAGDMLQYEYG